MPPIFSSLLLVALSVLAWRAGWVTRWRETRRLRKQTRSADFWTGYRPKPNGQVSWTTGMSDEVTFRPQPFDPPPNLGRCQAGCGRHAVSVWSLDADMYILCELHSGKSAKTLTDLGYSIGLSVAQLE